MANLRVDKITGTETFETTGSVQFDGDADYLEASNSDDFQLGTGDFTVEAWVLANDNSGSRQIISMSDGSENWQFFTHSGGTIRWNSKGTNDSGTIQHDADAKIDAKIWNHVAATRSGNTLRLFKNGIVVGTFGYNSDLTLSAGGPSIGIWDADKTSEDWNGHISNLRLIKGKALYTENFKPPMRELEVTAETVLLACQSKTDASLEKTGKTLTVSGNAVANELTPGLLTPIVKSGGGSAITGSVEFDGTSDYLSIPDSTDFTFGTGDFTIEFWRYRSRIGSTESYVTKYNNTNATSSFWFGSLSSGREDFAWYSGSSGYSIVSANNTAQVGEWGHLAAVRYNGDITLYLNGVAIGSDTSSDAAASFNDDSNPLIIGGDNYSGSTYDYQGFISNVRIVRGTALYTDDFIPPTRELKRVPGTVLLCCQDPNNPLTEATGKTITGYGDLNQLYGTELAINGQFTADSDWTKGDQWTISGGSASITDSPNRTSDSFLTQDGSSWIHPGQMYRVAVDWSLSDGDFDVRIGGDSNLAKYSISSYYSSPYYFDIEAGATNTNLEIIANQHMVGDINSIHVDYAPPSKAGSNFTPQVGDDRKVTFEGVTKINTDAYFYLPTGDTASREATGTYNSGTRAIFGAIQVYPTAGDSIHYATIATFGNTVDFGDLVVAKRYGAGCASKTRGIWGGGSDPAPSPNNKQSSMSYITIATTGDSLNFGDLTTARWGLSAFSNSTRGIFFSGNTSPANTDVIDYVTIASTGDALDFGDAFSSRRYPLGSTSDTTRGIDAGGHDTSDNVIQYVTFASTGNAQDFGDLTQGSDGGCGGVSNGTRGVFAGGYTPTQINTIQYITIQSMGNSKDFGDMTSTDARHGAAAESSVRGLFTHGGYPSRLNTIDAITIATTGNAVEFGDIIDIGGNDGGGDSGTQSGFSNGHGGLG